MSTILDEILEHKRSEVADAVLRVSRDEMAARARAAGASDRGFALALARAEAPAVIAEIKQRSPSRGVLREDFDPVECAQAYQLGGAACLSVLTDEHYFGGALGFLARVRAAVPMPLLRKDFIVDPYQIDEARVAGADAVLLIAAALSPEQQLELQKRAGERGLDTLVEVHDEGELDIALESAPQLVGVNNRDLKTFRTDLAVTERLARRFGADPRSQGRLLVSESGIHRPEDIARLQSVGAEAFLVGESLMREADMAGALRRLRGHPVPVAQEGNTT